MVIVGGGIPHTTASSGGTMNDKPAGWYYVGDGKLRYRDDYGWTDHYMDTSDPRAGEWPPPSPTTLLNQASEERAVGRAATLPRARRGSALFRRRRSAVK